MRLTKPSFAALAAAVFAAHVASAERTPELLDLAARIHYGYYHGEARTLEVAQAGLDRLAESPEVLYYRDFAALRRAQLGGLDHAHGERVEACAQREVMAGLAKRFAAEAWVLAAACALLTGDEDRSEEALAMARGLDEDNPRIALVEAWALERAAGADSKRSAALGEKLTAVVAGFDAWTPSIDDPDWGHAEALTALAATALARGQARAARDLIERALFLAPDYRAAMELRVGMQNAVGGRTL
jgi:hypothetical protein